MVAQYILNKDESESVVTVGLDDTTKAAGHKFFDIKTDYLTIAGPNHDRKSFTTGYIEYVSHSGKDGARAYGMKLQCLATLSNSTVDEIKSHIDFWICDRASDCKVLLENLDIALEKTLKCTAHVVLGVDYAIDKVFRNTEQHIDVQNLIDCGKILKSPSSSVSTVGLFVQSVYGLSTMNPGCNDRNWTGVKGFFQEKLSKLKTLCENFSKNKTGKGKLIGTVLCEVVETVNRQLAEMDYFDSESDIGEACDQNLKFAPLTNLGCESDFGKLDNRLRVAGGMTSINTHSNKNVATNGFLNSVDFVNSSETDRRAKWKWAGRSEEDLYSQPLL
ncbi:hypothetical protein LOTGIDRAFT_154967 [Lottia gigantea]|uniref:Uncharacterized protein n=1 Tax=Lottia gigantea TaxID=225164 RepID=V3ZX01_LOTGI|nr:hypothetical protein LOTGIDRAFT_154967 [Lottia gigantea]ESO85476.1 hypothetical protein LOTGIDRAFT_154967 [Lottia gigantea]